MNSLLCWIWPYLLGGLLGWLASGLLARKALARKPSVVEKIVERKVDRPVDRIVEKVVDNPAHLAEIASLTAVAGLVPGLRAQLSTLQAAPPKVVEKIVEKSVTDMAALEERDRKLADWSARYAALEAKFKLLQDGPAIDVQAAHAAGIMLKGPDDLEIIEGIGPKIAELLHQAGVRRFRQLAQMTAAQIQPILDRAGPNFTLANPGTWPEQASLAANNQWASLKALRDVLIAGLRK
jgi:predicted flap endonuclease-1-like 5' DNA nuclease